MFAILKISSASKACYRVYSHVFTSSSANIRTFHWQLLDHWSHVSRSSFCTISVLVGNSRDSGSVINTTAMHREVIYTPAQLYLFSSQPRRLRNTRTGKLLVVNSNTKNYTYYQLHYVTKKIDLKKIIIKILGNFA